MDEDLIRQALQVLRSVPRAFPGGGLYPKTTVS
jgi:hypothetical protein